MTKILEDRVICNNERIKDVVAGHELLQGHRLSLDNLPQGTVNNDGSVDFVENISRLKIRVSKENDGFEEEGEVFAALGLPNERVSANTLLCILMQGKSGTRTIFLGIRPHEHFSRGETTLVVIFEEGRHNSLHQNGMDVKRIGSTNGWGLRRIHLGGEHAGKTNYLAKFIILSTSVCGYWVMYGLLLVMRVFNRKVDDEIVKACKMRLNN
jgi:hypothetical protein